MSLTAKAALAKLRSIGDPEDAAFLQRFFKTGPGEYGAGDVFLGIRVPATRKVAAEYRDLPPAEVEKLLHAREHEARLLAVIILADQYKRGDDEQRQQIFDLYLRNTRFINNWDIVDSSAANIVGAHLFGGSTKILDKLARSGDLWERRIAIIATLCFIRKGAFENTLRIAETLLHDEHDLIHKAVGWMLREVGNRDVGAERAFLDKHHKVMPRTMLRYAIEKFPAELRARYMARP
jgi:3-methyladenine DNA glycosylase AlkD